MKAGRYSRSLKSLGIVVTLLVSTWAYGKSNSAANPADFFTSSAFTENLTELIDPVALSDWAKVMSNSESLKGLGQLDPGVLNSFMSVMTHPDFVRSMIDIGNPELVTHWLNTMTDPALMSAALQLIDPAAMQGWLSSVTNIELMKPLLGMVDADYFDQWIGVMTEPAVLDSVLRTLDPQLVMNLLGSTIPMMSSVRTTTTSESGDDGGISQ